MMLELDQIVLLTVSVASFGLGLVVYQRAPDRVWNRIFTVHAVAVGVWVFINYLLQSASSVTEAALWLRLTHPVVAVVICSCLDLAWVFPERIRPTPWLQRVLLYTAGLIFSLVALAPNLFTSIELTQGTVIVQYGWPFVIFGVFTMATLGYADWVLLKKSQHLTGLQQLQVDYVLYGLVVGQTIALVTMVILPLVWQNTYYSRWGSASFICVIVAMAYAIAKHHIVKPQTALYRLGTYLLTAMGVAGVIMGMVIVVERLVPQLRFPEVWNYLFVIAGIIMGMIAVPIHHYIRAYLDRMLLSQRQREDSAQQASDAILRTLDANELLEFLSGMVWNTLRPTQVSVFMKDGGSDSFVLRSCLTAADNGGGQHLPEQLPGAHILLQAASGSHHLLHRDEVFRFHSLDEAQQVARAMEELDTELLAPLVWEDELVGMVCIGGRVSEEIYEAEDLDILRNIMPQVSLALRNAQLYAEMARMKEYSETILREMESGVIVVDADEEVVMYNPAAQRILGIPREQIVGHTLVGLPENIANCLHKALNNSRMRSGYRFEIEKDDGEIVPVACSTSAWGGATDAREGAVAVISDLTMAHELEQERQRAEHLALIRVLSAGMAHEIRNPMVAIRTFAELLPRRWDDPEFRSDFLVTAQQEIERIDQLLSQLLMLSKPAAAATDTVDINGVCEGVVRAMSARAESEQIRLHADLNLVDGQPIGDESRLHQALTNLVANALDAEPEGGEVKVSTTQMVDADGETWVVIRVYNAGSYIPPGHTEQIFEPFYSDKPGGTGLGLAICQSIIQEHNGSISMRSAPDSGTEFVVQLPLETDVDSTDSGEE